MNRGTSFSLGFRSMVFLLLVVRFTFGAPEAGAVCALELSQLGSCPSGAPYLCTINRSQITSYRASEDAFDVGSCFDDRVWLPGMVSWFCLSRPCPANTTQVQGPSGNGNCPSSVGAAASDGVVNFAADVSQVINHYQQLVQPEDVVLKSGVVIDPSCFPDPNPGIRTRQLRALSQRIDFASSVAASCKERLGIDEVARIADAMKRTTVVCGRNVERLVRSRGALSTVRTDPDHLALGVAHLTEERVKVGEEQTEYRDQVVLQLPSAMDPSSTETADRVGGTIFHELLHIGRVQCDSWHVDHEEAVTTRTFSGCSHSFYEDPVYFLTAVCGAENKGNFFGGKLNTCTDLCVKALTKIVSENVGSASLWATKNPHLPRKYSPEQVEAICRKVSAL